VTAPRLLFLDGGRRRRAMRRQLAALALAWLAGLAVLVLL
jgi:hypothetical protein